MQRKRNKLEITRDILQSLERIELGITRLIYKSNLSNESIKPYIENLLQNNMIEKFNQKGKIKYKIADKGKVFLREYEQILAFTKSYGL